MFSKRMCVRRVCLIGIFFILFKVILLIWTDPLNTSRMENWKERAVPHRWNINFQDKMIKLPEAPAVNLTVNSIYDCLKHLPDRDILNFTCLENASFKRLKKRQNESLLVIVILHSHNDPGYKKTYDQYFHESTSKTLSQAVEKLHEYRDLTFAWPETCFLERWWKSQTAGARNKLKYLVKTGRFEIAAGTWVIADEALSHYFSFFDQLLEGHYWLKRHLGVTPTISFDLDQFSLTSSVRYMMRLAGIQTTVLKRIHMGVKARFMEENLMNFYWRQGWDINGIQDVFVQAEPYEWLSFPDSCGPSRKVCSDLDMTRLVKSLPKSGSAQLKDPIRLLNNYYSSLHDYADQLVRQLKIKARGYQHNVLLLPVGDDWKYTTASEWDSQYKNFNILMKYINGFPDFGVQMRFGTLKEYFDEVQIRTELYGLRYPVISGDFVPFTLSDIYWSGYYSTRQYLKVAGNQLQATVRAADILAALLVLDDILKADCTKDIFEKLISSRRELDLFQHHDAITGTVERLVAKDFEIRVRTALNNAQSVLQKLTVSMLFSERTSNTCDERLNTTVKFFYSIDEYSCRTIDASSKFVILNQYTQERRKIFCIETKQHVQIISKDGEVVQTDMIQDNDIFRFYFEAVIPPLGAVVYEASKIVDFKPEHPSKTNVRSQHEGPVVCENSEIRLTFNVSQKIDISMCNRKEGFCSNFSLELYRYTYSAGAYTFSTSGESKVYSECDRKLTCVCNSKLCSVSVHCSLYRLEFVLPLLDGIHGKYLQVFAHVDLSNSFLKKFSGELALRIVSQIQNGRTFYTDSNGIYLQKRKFRKTLPIGASVFPMTSQAVIEDRNIRLSVHSAQPHGVVGRNKGTLDIMLDRVATRREPGLYQEVEDNQPIVTKFFFFIEKIARASEEEAEVLIPTIDSTMVNDHILHPVFSFFIENADIKAAAFTFLQEPLPPDVIIANMKCFTTDDLKFDRVSLTLFKRLSLLSNDLDDITIKGLFKSTRRGTQLSKLWAVDETLPTHLQTLRLLSDTDVISMKAMDIKTFAFRPDK